MRKRIFEYLMLWFIKDNQFPYVLRTFWRQFRWWYPEDNIPSACSTILEVFDECADEDKYCRGDVITNFTLDPPKYWLREGGDANTYTIMKRENWFASIRVNGELPVGRQRKALNLMIEQLNRTDP